jgi:NitT/TauT family transport system substrate-binding protein
MKLARTFLGWNPAAVAALVLVLFSSQPGLAQTKVSILHTVIGPKQAALWVAQEQGLFAKHGVDVLLLRFDPQRPGRGQMTNDVLGAIGVPVAIGWAAEGSDLKVVAAFNNASSSTIHLVTKPEIKTAADLRGKRLGVNRVGTGSWIGALQALDHFGLDPKRDQIALVEAKEGALRQVQMLEDGDIDATVVDPSQSIQLQAKGFSLLLDMSTTKIPGIQDALAVTGPYLSEHPDVVEKVVAGLVEGIAFSLSPRNKEAVLKTLMARLNISSPEAAEVAYQEFLARAAGKPDVSVAAAQNYQRVLAFNDPRVLSVKIGDLVEQRFVRKLDENGTIDHFYNTYGVK